MYGLGTYGLGSDEPIRVDDLGTSISHYFGRNSIGSITAISDAMGNLVESYSYKAFGEDTIKDAAGVVLTSSQIENPYRFTSRRKDIEENYGAETLYY